MIILVGTPHSYTSAITKLLIDNGANYDDLWDNPKWQIGYTCNESRMMQEFVNKRKQFKKADINKYLASLPDNTVLKAPLMAWFLNEIDVPVKVVYCVRNVADIVASSEQKVKKGFMHYFNRNTFIYDAIVNCKHPVHLCMTERILKNDIQHIEQLLDYCGLKYIYPVKDLQPIKLRKRIFLRYRISNFFVKQLSKFMR